MNHQHLIFAALFLGLTLAPDLTMAEDATTLTLIQDEPLLLPRDNSAMFSAARDVSIQLDVIAATETSFDDALVTVVRPDGETSEFRPDEKGMVVVDEVEPGPHAIVASGKRAHGTMLFYFEKSEPSREALPDVLRKGLEPGPGTPSRMTMLVVGENDLRPFVNRIRGVGNNESVDEVDASVRTGAEFGYRIQLDQTGTISGRVLSVMRRSADVRIAGTRIAIFRNGDRIGTTTSDSSGRWRMGNLEPGVHGLIAAGPDGYAAFAFEAVLSNQLAATKPHKETFATKRRLANEELPVVLVARPFCPQVVESITTYYPTFDRDLGPTSVAGGPDAPFVRGFGRWPTAGPTSAGSVSAGAGGYGATGAFGASELLTIGIIGATVAAANTNENNQLIIAPPVATPSSPFAP